ncbi:MAG: DUF5666 domain-containing protein [Acidobacteria bacterium]|nr:DUF5666 domain-containing protein [Acidobacteriota bacterium]
MQRRTFWLVMVGIVLVLFPWPGLARPQQGWGNHPQGMRGRSPGERAFGTITSVGANQFQIKKPDGSLLTVLVSGNTRYWASRQEIQFKDLKPGDHVFVMGQTGDNKQFDARTVRRMTEEEVARFRNMGDRAFGQIVSIENNQLKIKNPYRGEQTIIVNDQTQFMKEGQAITLKDLKVGDRIFAMGKEENGKLVADRVITGQFRRRGGGMRQGPPPPQQ